MILRAAIGEDQRRGRETARKAPLLQKISKLTIACVVGIWDRDKREQGRLRDRAQAEATEKSE
jgi:hypothetical protein